MPTRSPGLLRKMSANAAPASHAPILTGRTRRIAERLVEAAFPAGERLPAPDPGALLAVADGSLAGHAGWRRAVKSLLWWLELRYLARHGTRFSRASCADRSAFLRRHAGSAGAGTLLRAVSLPFRMAYLRDATHLARMKTQDGIPVPSRVEPARWRAQISAAADVVESQEIECDVVVVGTGAGGAAAAYELAGRGLAVVLVEEGHFYDRRDFNGRLTDVIPRLYRGPGAIPAIGNHIIPIPIGRSVGGTTTINSGTCLRTPDATLAEWRAEGLADFTPERLAPDFEAVETVLRVAPADPRYVGEIGRVIADGARHIGFSEARPLLRNAEGCDGQGLCQFGCPTDAKQSTNVSFIPRALDRGAFLWTGFRVDELLRARTSGPDDIRGVLAHGRNAAGETVMLTVNARATILSMGSLLTPNFLRAQGVKNAWLGNNLSIHPAGAVTAWFPDREFDNGATIPQGFGVHDLREEGLLFEGGTIPFLAHGLLSPLQAEDFVRFAERYQQIAYFGILVKDTSRGRVRRGISRDLPLVTYRLNAGDFARFRRGIDLLAKMYLAAGAREVWIPGPARMTRIENERELAAFWATHPKPRHFLITAYHPLGTARIGATPEGGVCDDEHRVWNTEGLYVIDGSSVPGSLGVNPQVTIMALAIRAARKLGDRLSS